MQWHDVRPLPHPKTFAYLPSELRSAIARFERRIKEIEEFVPDSVRDR
jgi:hypothetical protein